MAETTIATLRAKLDAAQAMILELEARKDATTWEADHQGAILKRWGLYDEFVAGCDSIEGVCEALVASRGTTRHLRKVVQELKQELRDAHDRADTNAERVQRVMAGRDKAVEAAFRAALDGAWMDIFEKPIEKQNADRRYLAYKAGLKGEGENGKAE